MRRVNVVEGHVPNTKVVERMPKNNSGIKIVKQLYANC